MAGVRLVSRQWKARLALSAMSTEWRSASDIGDRIGQSANWVSWNLKQYGGHLAESRAIKDEYGNHILAWRIKPPLIEYGEA